MCRCGKKLLKRLAGVRLRLQLDVVLDAHLVDEIELRLDVVDVLLLIVEDLVEQVA